MKKPRKLSRARAHAGVENLSLFGLKARMGPVGLSVYAQAYARAARELGLPEGNFDHVRYQLACHSIELSLKTCLSIRGASLVELSESQPGHDLSVLLDAAEKGGLAEFVQLTPLEKEAIRHVTDYYVGKVFQYPALAEAVHGYSAAPEIGGLLDAADRLAEALNEPSLSASDPGPVKLVATGSDANTKAPPERG